jgi:hypothetical protein
MMSLIYHVLAWPTFFLALLVFGFAPGAALRLIVLAYKRDDPRRQELLSELYAVPRIGRPFWVAQQLETALFDGLRGRLAAQRAKRMVPAVIHLVLDDIELTLELMVTAELKRAGLPLEGFIEAYDRAVQDGTVKLVHAVQGIKPVTPWMGVWAVPRQEAA